MKFRSILVAALAALTLAACSKDKDNGEIDLTDPASEGGVASLKISFSLPNTVAGGVNSRATEDATQAESTVNTVSVYVFKTNGDLPSQGDYFSLTSTDFDSGTTVGSVTTYEMITNPLRTTSGNKKIYVGINLPTALDGAVSNEAELLAKIADVDGDLLHYSGTTLDDLVMFGITEQLLYDTDMEPDGNEVDVEMARAMARVITTYDDSQSNISSTGEVTVSFTSGVTLTYQIEDFFVVQDAYRSYLAPNYTSDGKFTTLIDAYSFADRGQVVNLYDPKEHLSPNSNTIDYKSVAADPGNNNRASLDGFYIGENVTTRDRQQAQYGNTTYAYIQTQVAVNQGAYLNGTVGDASATIDWTAGAISAGTNLVVINVLSNSSVSNNSSWVGTYLCTQSNSGNILAHLQAIGYGSSDLTFYTYYESYVYFPVFLNANNTNKTGLDKYNIYRNEFINIQIAGINASFEDGFGGYPGDETDPTVPVDPGEEDTQNPNPWEPEEPIDENDADLTINIIVNPWDYISNVTILE